MPKTKRAILSSVDVGGWARHYASRPYGHYKKEVYQLFIDILGCLRSNGHILDVGAGPGHLAHEYFKRYQKSRSQFVLLDSSEELLKIARSRLKSRAKQIKTALRDLNSAEWDRGIGRFDAIVSNNAIFCVWKENLESFYAACFSRLKKSGIMLNQQTFAHESSLSPYGKDALSTFVQALPESILPKVPNQTAGEKRRLLAEKAEATEKQRKAMEELKVSGIEIPKQRGYQFLTVERHLECMRKAGFACGCIWRKREFAVILGVKGRPIGKQ